MGKKRPDHLRPFSTFCLVLFDGFRNRSRQLLHASPKAPTFDTLPPASMHSYPSYMACLVNSILIPTNNNNRTPSPAQLLNHHPGTETLNQNWHMRDNTYFSAQRLQGIQAGDGYIQGFRVQATEAFVDKQRFNLGSIGG